MLTPWFDSEKHSPVRLGVYLATVDKREKYYRRWDGRTWCVGGDTPDEAAQQSVGVHFHVFWRGLAQEPKS